MVIYRDEKTDKKNSILRYIGNRVLRNNRNFLCLSGDTVLYGHNKSLKELWDSGTKYIDTVSLTKPVGKNGGYYPINSKSEIIYSGKKDVYEIELENGKKIYATSEHRLFKKVGHTFKDTHVKDLCIGDNLRDFNINWIKNYYIKKNLHSKKIISKNYNHFNKCIKCFSLIYTSRYRGCKTKKYCKSCLSDMDNKYKERKGYDDNWFEWEDNLLRKLYMNEKKKIILGLLSNRNWSAISHRAIRLGLANGRRKTYYFSTKKMTSIENKVSKFLDKENIRYEFNKTIKDNGSIFIPDFVIGNLIIECDGEYWHKDRKEKDKKRQERLEEIGFIVIRFTGNQINKEFSEVKKCILQRLSQ